MNHQTQSVERAILPSRPTVIDVKDGRSVMYWTSKLKCSWPQLDHAIKQVGSDPAKVKAFLSIE
jgi:Protein of unknown function (DUF3606)